MSKKAEARLSADRRSRKDEGGRSSLIRKIFRAFVFGNWEKTSLSHAPEPRHQGMREMVESLVVAIILAFLFRGFVAEAFVIPTGSMATTLFGRHNDVICAQCKYTYQTGASVENADRGRGEVVATTCPICRFTMVLDKRSDPNQRSFDGDRILVSKFDYDLAPPQRWDVTLNVARAHPMEG